MPLLYTSEPSLTRLRKIQVVLDREHEVAKQQLAAGNKDRALVALRRRKYQEGLLAKTDGQLENLEQLVRFCYPSLYRYLSWFPRSRSRPSSSRWSKYLSCMAYSKAMRL